MIDAPVKPAKQTRNIDVRRRAEIGKERRARTRARIQTAAFELLGRVDGLYTSIEEICRAADVSRGTFYNYFTSTQELFESLAYELSHDFLNAVLEITNEMPEAEERTAAAVRLYLRRAALDHQWGWGMVNISINGVVFGAETYAQARRTIDEGIRSGAFNVANADLGRDICLGTTLACMMTLLRKKQRASYPTEVAQSILLSLGVPDAVAAEVVARRLPSLNQH